MGKFCWIYWFFSAASIFFAASAVAQRGPVIEHIEPTSGPPSTVVYIEGQGLGDAIEVKLGVGSLLIERVFPNRIVVKIPPGAQNGVVMVRTPAGEASGPEFRVTEPLAPPAITGFKPESGPPGTEVTIRGSNFSMRLVRNSVTLGDAPLIVRSASPIELKVIVPERARTGRIGVQVMNAGSASSEKPFRVTATTAITGFQPRIGSVGAKVVISGSGFSARPADNRVYLNTLALPMERAGESELVVTVPERAVSGYLLVDVLGGGSDRSKEPFIIQRQPTVIGFAPMQGVPGRWVTIFGTNFGKEPKAVDARLGEGSQPMVVHDARETELVVEIPAEAKPDKFSVKVNGVGPVRSAEPFQVLEPLRITGFSPRSGPPGTVVTIDGTGFSSDVSQNFVRLGHSLAEVISASANMLRARIGNGPSVPITVSVQGSGTVRADEPFILTRAPQILSFEPQKGPLGSEVAIRGSGFGNSAAAVKVALCGAPLEVLSTRDDIIVARVAAGCKRGRLEVSVALEGSAVSDTDFEVVSEPKPVEPKPAVK